MTERTIDLNCDLGECDDAAGIANDLALLDIVTSANIACGGHAGDMRSMERTIVAAVERGVALGAHPGYPDRANFGRVSCAMDHLQLASAISTQIETLLQIAVQCDGKITHVKPHGALYHAAMTQPDIAELIADVVASLGLPAILVGQANSPALETWRRRGFRVAVEAFADRRYEPDGTLRSRAKPDSIIEDPAQAAQQAVRIARGDGVISVYSDVVALFADTLCLHSDTPNAINNARAVRAALERVGVRCQALT